MSVFHRSFFFVGGGALDAPRKRLPLYGGRDVVGAIPYIHRNEPKHSLYTYLQLWYHFNIINHKEREK